MGGYLSKNIEKATYMMITLDGEGNNQIVCTDDHIDSITFFAKVHRKRYPYRKIYIVKKVAEI